MPLLPSAPHQFLYFALSSFGLLIALSGLLLVLAGVSTAYWPSTTGKILSSSFTSSTSAKPPKSYSPCLIYEYSVHGRSHISGLTRLVDFSFASESEAERYAVTRPINSSITVYYFPLAPSLAVLERGPSVEAGIILVAGASFFLGLRLLGEIALRRSSADT